MNPYDIHLEAVVAAYLDGDLDPDERALLERRFGEPEVQQALEEELVLRGLLGALGPDEVPVHLTARIEAELGIVPGRDKRKDPSMLGAALAGVAWALYGPGLATESRGFGGDILQPTTEGLGMMRFALGPLAPAPRAASGTAKKKPSLKRRLARRLLGRR